MNYKVVTDPSELLRLGWQELVASHPDGTVFQSPDMYELFARADRMDPVTVGVVEDGKESLAGILLGVVIREMKGPAGYFSARTVVYGGPLIRQDEPSREKVLDLLLHGLTRRVSHRSVFIQFRNFRDMTIGKGTFGKHRYHYRERLNYLVDTSSEAIVKARMGPEKMRQVKKGMKYGAVITPVSTEEEMRDLFDILEDLYRHKVKKPLPGWAFFREFYRLSREGRLGVTLLVKREGRVIGGIVCPVTPGKTIYEWYVCGLDQKYREAYPSVLATWAAIDHALRHGLKTFDFMGVGIPGRSYGVRLFKSRFGGELVNFGRFARINHRAVYFVSEMGYNLMAALKKI